MNDVDGRIFIPDEEFDNRGVRPGIHFHKKDDKKVTSPFYSLDENQNTPERFVILKTTGNGKFVKGGMLRYKYNGVEIFTDIKNAIFVDTMANMVTIRDYDKVLSEIDPVDPEHKQYLFLLYDEYSEDNICRWEVVEGRSRAYEFVKENIELYNPKKSLVLTDNVALKDALSIYQFVIHLQNSNLVEDDGFDIDEYNFIYDDEE